MSVLHDDVARSYAFSGLKISVKKNVLHEDAARLILFVEYTGLEPATF